MIVFDKRNSTGLKGIAILLMLHHHNFRDVSLFENYTVSFFPFPQEWVVNVADMAKICVSLFAFISGYGLYLSCKSRKVNSTKWVVNRYVKTFAGYWLIWVLSGTISQIISRRVSKIFLKTNIWEALINIGIDFLGVANLFDSPTLNGTWWYMSAAFVFILLTPLLVKYEEKLWLILAGVIVFLRVICRGAGEDIFPGGTSTYAFLTPFIFGMIFAKNNYIEKIVNGNYKPVRFILEIVLLIIAYKVYKNIPTSYYWEVKWGLIPLLVILFSVEFILTVPGVRQLLIFLGKHSMNIFMVHTFIRAYYLADFTYSWGHFAIITIVLLLVSLGISLIVEGIKKIIQYDGLVKKICQKIENV